MPETTSEITVEYVEALQRVVDGGARLRDLSLLTGLPREQLRRLLLRDVEVGPSK